LSDLTSAPFSLSLGDPVFAKVIAVNAKGSSPESDAGSGATIITKPDKPTALAEVTAQRSASTLGLSWTAGAADGGSPVYEYRVQMAILGQAFSILDSTATTAYLVTGLTAGVSYVFKVEARNEYGYSDLSAPLTLLCAYIADIPTNVQTLMVESDTYVQISWDLGSDNGSAISEFKVYIKQHGSETYTREKFDCLGVSQAVIDARSCRISVDTLLAAPYNILGGDSIYAKVLSQNSYGQSALSEAGNGAIYYREPDAPLNLAEDISHRSETTDGITWTEGLDNGGLTVEDYRVSIRVQGSTSYTVAAESVAATSYTLTNLVLGTTYQIVVEARNAYGHSS
jgi:hypothetical protein